MGICYRLFVHDEFDWGYVGFDRNKVRSEIEAVVKDYGVEQLADLPYLMIFDIGKAWPGMLFGKVTCDTLSYTTDNNFDMTLVVEN